MRPDQGCGPPNEKRRPGQGGDLNRSSGNNKTSTPSAALRQRRERPSAAKLRASFNLLAPRWTR